MKGLDKQISLCGFTFVCEKGGVKHNGRNICEVQISGEDKPTHLGCKLINSSEGSRFAAQPFEERAGCVVARQQSPFVRAETILCPHACGVLTAYTQIENISDSGIELEEVSALVLSVPGTAETTGGVEFTRFTQSHHSEGIPVTNTLQNLGLVRYGSVSQKAVRGGSAGCWTTKEELPQGVLRCKDEYFAFMIESADTWQYEIGDDEDRLYLWLGGETLGFGGLRKRLAKGETYRTPRVAVCKGGSLNEVLQKLTLYKREIAAVCESDAALPVIFNSYMHLFWDNPTEEGVRRFAPAAARAGAAYFVIDCGWHDEVPANEIYPYVGEWKESRARFPSGLRKSVDFIRSLSMKAGLWIEPEIVGARCEKMLAYYGEDCLLKRNGKPIAVMGRRFLDYRNRKVREYMGETFRRMIEDYGAEYIKTDCNQEIGFCVDGDLREAREAFYSFIEEVKAKYPHVLIEGCASGGMRLDYRSLAVFPVVSTSDQVDYLRYTRIAANVFAGVLPEQAGIWCYPVVADAPTDDGRLVVNCVNSMLGRIHLAGDLSALNERQMRILRGAMEYAQKIADDKKRALPYWPLGLAKPGDTLLACGLKTESKLYLAVWNLGEGGAFYLPLAGLNAVSAVCAFPAQGHCRAESGGICVELAKQSAALCEIELMP